jgi:hypothetical protein
MRPPAERTVDYSAYGTWRTDSLSKSWSAFDNRFVTGKDVPDLGGGDGLLAFFYRRNKISE